MQIRSFGRLLEGRPDAMPAWRQASVEIADPEVIRAGGSRLHPIVVPSGHATAVEGIVFGIAPAEVEAADRYEVADHGRVEVDLRSGTRPGTMREA